MKPGKSILCILLAAAVAGSAVWALSLRKGSAQYGVYLLEGMEAPVYYTSTKPVTDGDRGKVVVIMAHGWGGGTGLLEEQVALQEALGDMYVVAPLFARSQTMERDGIAPDGRVVWNDSWSRDLTKPGVPDDDWRGGGDANGTSMSSYDVIDSLFARFADKRLFPRLKKVVLVGFSAGGQFVGRYVAVGKGTVRPGVEVAYAAMAPSTELVPSSDVIWHYGLAGRPRYSRDLSEAEIMENLRTRRCLHACGALDTLETDLDRTPNAMKQGPNRYERFLSFRSVVESDPLWADNVVFHVFDSLGHDASGAYSDPVFISFVK